MSLENQTLVDQKDIPNLSPYAQFVLENLGYEFFDKETGEKLYKWEIYNTFENRSSKLLQMVYSNIHSQFGRRKRIENLELNQN